MFGETLSSVRAAIHELLELELPSDSYTQTVLAVRVHSLKLPLKTALAVCVCR